MIILNASHPGLQSKPVSKEKHLCLLHIFPVLSLPCLPPFGERQKLVFKNQFSLSAVDFGERVQILWLTYVFVH